MSSADAELSKILSDVRCTFSKNCCSGIVRILGKRRRCQCWRCRQKRGQNVTIETELKAARLSRLAREKLKRRTRLRIVMPTLNLQ